MRSTFIVGFPGETDEHVDYLERWIERAQLDRVGFFEYSAEEGTPAAELSARVGIARRRRRLIRLREAQRVASERARAARCGTTVRVLAEEFLNAKRAWFGRSKVKRQVSMVAFTSQETLRSASSSTYVWKSTDRSISSATPYRRSPARFD